MIDRDSSPLGLFSRKRSGTETHYSNFDKKLLAAFSAVKKWKNLVNSERLIDHKCERQGLRRAEEANFIHNGI